MVKHRVEVQNTGASAGQAGCHIPGFQDLTLLDGEQEEESPEALPAGEPAEPSSFPDRVYVLAAAIFQNAHVEKPAAHRLISYGKRTDEPLPEAREEATQRAAYELTFNALKYQDLLEDIMVDSCFYVSQSLPEDLMSLAVVMLYDFMDRKFLPRERPDGEEEEDLKDVREVESCLLRFKTKLAASLARCRIKHDLLTIDNILPACVRKNKERADSLFLYAWVNTLKNSLQDVCTALKREGFSQVNSIRQLEGLAFCQDPHCRDLLAFPPRLKADLGRTGLLREHGLVIQDKSRSLAPNSVRPLLAQDSDVLMAGSFSGLTIAHMAALTAPTSGSVLVCGDDWSPAQREELHAVLSSMGCKNVKLLAESFLEMDEWDAHMQKVRVVLLMPQCSASALSNPVEYILSENGNADLLRDLSQGSITPAKLDELVASQTRDLTHALKFPKVQAVVYCTCSIYREENEDVVLRALERGVEGPKQQPYRLSVPPLASGAVPEEGSAKERFFKMEPSEQSDGCFLAVLTREPNPAEAETVQNILARAAAKGLLDGIGPSRPPKKERRRRKKQTTPSRPAVRSHASSGNQLQSQIEEFLSREGKLVSSEPTVAPQQSGGAAKTHSPRRRPLAKATTANANTSPSRKNAGKVTNTTRKPAYRRPAAPNQPVAKTGLAGPANPPVPPAPPGSRQEVLRSMESRQEVLRPAESRQEVLRPMEARQEVLRLVEARQEVLRPVELVLPPVSFPSSSSLGSGKTGSPLPLQAPSLFYPGFRGSSQASLSRSSIGSSGSRDRASAVWHPRPWM
ncbi:putative methyltransferase NSUN7 [Megalops cyprinoides]|uniref:putative methyltransferase NSUN7 n=1 Tax=Megalops cyprinoides TaxID=118141 RepID=UPI001864FEFC|nr:putative methyltransferase NSUN7 [Megalops cyprinoides]